MDSNTRYDLAKGVATVTSGFVYVTGGTTGMDGNTSAGGGAKWTSFWLSITPVE